MYNAIVTISRIVLFETIEYKVEADIEEDAREQVFKILEADPQYNRYLHDDDMDVSVFVEEVL